jgi:hypothetical protein
MLQGCTGAIGDSTIEDYRVDEAREQTRRLYRDYAGHVIRIVILSYGRAAPVAQDER